MSRLALAWLVVALAGATAAASGEGRVETRLVVAGPVHVGDPVTLEVVVENGPSSLASDASFAPFELAGAPTSVDLGEGRFALRVPLRAFRTGALEVPSVAVTTASGARLETERVPLLVAPISRADATPASPKLVLDDVRSGPLVPVLLAAFAVTALGYRLARRLEGRPVPNEVALVRDLASRFFPGLHAVDASVTRPPSVSTRRRIARLVDSGLAESNVALFHEKLKRIAVEHLRDRYRLGRDERTSTEIVREVAARGGSREAAEVARLLAACDRVEFAGDRPTRDVALATAALAARLASTASREP